MRFRKDVGAHTCRRSNNGLAVGYTSAIRRRAPPRKDSRTTFTRPKWTQTQENATRSRKKYAPIGADLFHSRRDVDFEIILNTGDDAKNAAADAAIRIDSLDAWSTPIVACTVDAVLGIVQNNRRGLFAWPALAQSAFVFDEIHAYDDRLFGALLRFLRDLPGLPSLLMTASLPKAREDALRMLLKEYRGIDLIPIAGPTELEELPRYKKATLENNDPLPLVRETLENGGKVLWVCNTVKRVMDAADRTSDCNPLIYHSRFKYEDRVQRHKAVIDAFKEKGAALAICSQVAEMSLDLSADLLVTDLATVPALIQRLGRLNRRAKTKRDKTKPFVVIEPDSFSPYMDKQRKPDPPDWPTTTRAWLAKLPGDDISQKHLADMWEQNAESPLDYQEQMKSAWLDGGPKTQVGDLREVGAGITVLMEQDLPRVRANRNDLGKLTLPMTPTRFPWQTWPRERVYDMVCSWLLGLVCWCAKFPDAAMSSDVIRERSQGWPGRKKLCRRRFSLWSRTLKAWRRASSIASMGPMGCRGAPSWRSWWTRLTR